MAKPAFPAGTIIAEGTLYQEPKKISSGDRATTIALKVRLDYREREDDERDAFFVDVLVSGSSADNILKAGWKNRDRVFFTGKFKGRRWERKLEDGGVNEEQSITIFADSIGASPRFTEVEIAEQEYNGGGKSDNDDRPSRRRGGDDEDAPRSSRRSSSRDDDDDDSSSRRSSRRSSDDEDETPRSSRRSTSRDDDEGDEEPARTRRSSRRARDTSYED
jgi:single-stranded DNA-binding protein